MLLGIELTQLRHAHEHGTAALDLAIEDLVGVGGRQLVLPSPHFVHLVTPAALAPLFVGGVHGVPERRQRALRVVQDPAHPDLEHEIARLLERPDTIRPGSLHSGLLLSLRWIGWVERLAERAVECHALQCPLTYHAYDTTTAQAWLATAHLDRTKLAGRLT